MRGTLVLAALTCLFLPLAAAANDPTLPYIDGQICLMAEEGISIEEINERWGTITIEVDPAEDLYLVKELSPLETPAFAELMNEDPEVLLAEPNYRIYSPEAIRMMVVPAIGGDWDDYVDQGLTERIGLPLAHTMSTGQGIRIAVLDTGIDPDHEVFQGRICSDGKDYLQDDHEPWEEADGVDNDGDGLVDEAYGHGSMVAGLALLAAPDAQILPLRVLNDEGWGTAFDIARATVYASSHGAHVINMSFGAPQWIYAISRKLKVANVHGSFIVSGAGNRGEEEPPYYPGSDERAFMVTAVDSSDVKADFADYHALVDVAAPGVGVRSAYPGGEWGLGAGCSFAIPLLSGEIALILSMDPSIQVQDLRARVWAGTDPIDQLPGNAPYAGKLGAGRINVPLALTLDAAHAPDAVAQPFALSASPNPSNGKVRIRLAGPEPGGIQRLEIFDPSGRSIRTYQAAGQDGWTWDGKDRHGRPAPAGTYLIRAISASGRAATQVTVLR